MAEVSDNLWFQLYREYLLFSHERLHESDGVDLPERITEMPHHIIYLPLETHPEPAPEAAIRAALGFASGLGHGVHVSTFSVKIPPVASPLGGFLINIEGMARAAEDQSAADCKRLHNMVEQAAGPGLTVQITSHQIAMGGTMEAAVAEARYFDLSVIPWSPDVISTHDLSQALIFGAGTPVILVPSSAKAGPLQHIAVAWDESRAAARALGDALRLLSPGGRVSVLTVHDEKDLGRSELSQTLAAALSKRGYDAHAVDLTLGGKDIATVLQSAAVDQGAGLLAMGGFGHSRLRDFILGGATKGVIANLRLAVLLSH